MGMLYAYLRLIPSVSTPRRPTWDSPSIEAETNTNVAKLIAPNHCHVEVCPLLLSRCAAVKF